MPPVDVLLEVEDVATSPAAMGEMKSQDPGVVLRHQMVLKPCAVMGRLTSGVLSAAYGTQLTTQQPIKGSQLVVCEPIQTK